MSIEQIANEYTRLWNKINSFSPELQEIYWTYFDETGRPVHENVGNLCMISLLNKNAQNGFAGFKEDMRNIFSEKAYSQEQLISHYNVYVAGAKYLADKMSASYKIPKGNSSI